MIPAAALRFLASRLCVLLGLVTGVGVGDSMSSDEYTLDTEVEEGLDPIDDSGRTSGRPGGGVVTKRILACAFGDGVGAGIGNDGDENFLDGILDFELEKSASGMVRGSLGMKRDVSSVDARGRTPISTRGSTTGSEVCSGGGGRRLCFRGASIPSSDSCRPFPLSTLLERLDLAQSSLKLKCESLRLRFPGSELRVLCFRSLSVICTSVSAS